MSDNPFEMVKEAQRIVDEANTAQKMAMAAMSNARIFDRLSEISGTQVTKIDIKIHYGDAKQFEFTVNDTSITNGMIKCFKDVLTECLQGTLALARKYFKRFD